MTEKQYEREMERRRLTEAAPTRTDHVTIKAQRRKIRNRISAVESRRQRKKELEELQRTVDRLQEDVAYWRDRCTALVKEKRDQEELE